jgi:hypothetical protein
MKKGRQRCRPFFLRAKDQSAIASNAYFNSAGGLPFLYVAAML